MRRATWALTIAFALGVGGMLSAEESGNWFTRLFSRSTEKDAPKKSSTAKDGTPSLTPTLPNVAVVRAQADLQRRQDVCIKLREIAIASNDDELRQRAEQLDERAYKLFSKTSQQRREAQQPIGEYNLKDAKSSSRRAKGNQ